jgi:hypothetical protein
VHSLEDIILEADNDASAAVILLVGMCCEVINTF